MPSLTRDLATIPRTTARRVAGGLGLAVAGFLTGAGSYHARRDAIWHRATPGLDWMERSLADSESAGPVHVVVVRIDPARFRFDLEASISPGGTTPLWTVDDAPSAAALALNAGQFTGSAPWGWVVHHGREARAPGVGPLSSALVIDHTGAARIVDAGELASVRASGAAAEAIQSYPTLLRGDGEIPPALTHDGLGVDLHHRDARLAIGIAGDGHLLIVLTRYDGLGSPLGSVPLGPTVGEMAALMRRLGCRRAVSLDGGLSSQLLLRSSDGTAWRWRGWRTVPLGLVAMPR